MRFELKFSYPSHIDSLVVAWIGTHEQGFRANYPARRVNNIYFDTVELRALHENLAGISQRCKMRYRWYGEAALPARGVLEFKNKRAMLGWKDGFAIEHDPCTAEETWRSIRRKLRAEFPAEARIAFDHQHAAVLINRYRRRYFESRDHRLRITLDSEQVMFDQLQSPRPNLHRRVNVPEVNILEVKCGDRDYDRAIRALADSPVRVTRFSKYTVGTELR